MNDEELAREVHRKVFFEDGKKRWEYIAEALAKVRRDTAIRCFKLAEENAFVPPSEWGEGAKYNADKIANLIKKEFGLDYRDDEFNPFPKGKDRVDKNEIS